MLAKVRCARQAAVLERRERAIAAADALLGAFWQQPAVFPRQSSGGALPGSPGLAWRTRRIANAAAQALEAQVIRLEIVEAAPVDGAATEGQPLATVEVLLPSEGKK